jgi:hypothetical protein
VNNHWHSGDTAEPLPRAFNRFRRDAARARRDHIDQQTGVEVRIEPGAGDYEDAFKRYWMVVLWLLLGYHGTAMLILLFHMAWAGSIYLWIPHLIGTSIITSTLGFTACIYRFILFPSPGYYSRAPNVSLQDFDVPDDIMRQPSGAQPAPAAKFPDGVAA